MSITIPSKKRKELFAKLKKANTSFQKVYPGDKPDRQAVHTVYGGANLFKSDSAKVLGQRALETFHAYAPDFLSFGKVFGLDGIEKIDGHKSAYDVYSDYSSSAADQRKKHPAHLSYQVYNKVINKLTAEAIE